LSVYYGVGAVLIVHPFETADEGGANSFIHSSRRFI